MEKSAIRGGTNVEDTTRVQVEATGDEGVNDTSEVAASGDEEVKDTSGTAASGDEGVKDTSEADVSSEKGDNAERTTNVEEVRQVTFEGAEQTAEGEDETVKSKLKDPHKLLARSQSIDDSVRKSPGFCFITRPDLYKFAKVSNYHFNVLPLPCTVEPQYNDHIHVLAKN